MYHRIISCSSDHWLYCVVSQHDGCNTIHDGHGCTCIFMCVRNETFQPVCLSIDSVKVMFMNILDCLNMVLISGVN